MIVNIFFKNRVSPRNGAQADLENIERLLNKTAGFKSVHVHIDLSRRKVLEIMDEISNSSEMGAFNVDVDVFYMQYIVITSPV